MKSIGKLTVFGVFVAVLFLYRTELTGYISNVGGSSTSTIEDASWSGLRDQAYEAYDLSDIDAAIVMLNQYQETLTDELRKHDYGQEGLMTARRDVICELSVVHAKLSQKYYQAGNEEEYYNNDVLYRDYLSQCATYKQRENG